MARRRAAVLREGGNVGGSFSARSGERAIFDSKSGCNTAQCPMAGACSLPTLHIAPIGAQPPSPPVTPSPPPNITYCYEDQEGDLPTGKRLVVSSVERHP